MFPRIITHKRNDKTYSYLHISESIRKDGKSTTRDIANLGNIERFKNKDIENIIDGLIKIFQLEQYSLGKEVQIIKSLDYATPLPHLFVSNELGYLGVHHRKLFSASAVFVISALIVAYHLYFPVQQCSLTMVVSFWIGKFL